MTDSAPFRDAPSALDFETGRNSPPVQLEMNGNVAQKVIRDEPNRSAGVTQISGVPVDMQKGGSRTGIHMPQAQDQDRGSLERESWEALIDMRGL